MVERLRALLERPLDPRLARAVVALAGAVTIGFAALGLLAGGEGGSGSLSSAHPSGAGRPATTLSPSPGFRSRRAGSSAPPRQDPQDRLGDAAHRRAEHELATHRALQHVPYRRGGVAIDLVGARGERAVLAVRAPSLRMAHRGWRAFLNCYRDDGHAYIPVFRSFAGAAS